MKNLPIVLACCLVMGCAAPHTPTRLAMQESVYVKLPPASTGPSVIEPEATPTSALLLVAELTCLASVGDEGRVKQAMHQRARELGALLIRFDRPETSPAPPGSLVIDQSVTIQPRRQNAFADGMAMGSNAVEAGMRNAQRQSEAADALKRVYRARLYAIDWPHPVNTPQPLTQPVEPQTPRQP